MELTDELKGIYSPIKEELLEVERRLYELVPANLEPISTAEKYIFNNGGKRLRPALILLSARLAYSSEPRRFSENNEKRIIDFAVAAELIHTATLVHDDLLDGSLLRRRRRTINSRWGREIAILLGDHLYLKATQLLTERDIFNPASGYSKQIHQASNVMLQTASRIFEGEILQYGKRGKLSTNEEDYFTIIENKSASFISSCCIIGALLSRNEDEAINSAKNDGIDEYLASYGLNLGIAFQIIDDILDLMGDEKRLGKAVGSDLKEGRLTLPMIHLIANINGSDRKYIESILESSVKRNKQKDLYPSKSNGFDKRQLRRIKKLLLNNNSIAYSTNTANTFAQKAKDSLETLPDSIAKQSLVSLADQVINRDY